MKFTLNWLKDYLETDASLEEIGDRLTAIGLEVEEISDDSEALTPFVVAEIVETEKHPNADKLKVCKVKAAQGELQIVCGAPNARAGIKVALANVGTVIPTNDIKIKQSKIRDVESNGMLCSAKELGLGEDHAGIIELPESATIGDSIVNVLGLNDPMIDIAITPDRGDCLGVYGIARDLAATGIGTLQSLKTAEIKRDGTSPIQITIQDEHCPAFAGCVVKGVKNGASPEWMQRRLKAIGLRPISSLVDITNYISYDLGRPLHVYDLAKLEGNIIVRKGDGKEQVLALNEKEYTLDPDTCVIADEKKALGIGGIMGGERSGCTEETTDVLIECALFDAVNIAQTGRKLNIISDARYRFERGVDVVW
jgi:phenylalanyl-tRNA synthetase beta chain